MNFLLVNEGCYNTNRPDNFVNLLIKATQCQNYDELVSIYKELDRRLSGQAYRELKESFLKFAHYIVGHGNLDKLTAADTLTEVATMMRTLPEKMRDQGLAQGMA